MKFTVEVEDSEFDALATAIVEKMKEEGLVVAGGEKEDEPVEDDDDLTGGGKATAASKGPTLEEVQDAITAAAKLNKPAVKALLAKFGVERGSELGEDKYAKFLEGVKKIKKA